LPSVMVELSAGMKISRILARTTIRPRRRGLAASGATAAARSRTGTVEAESEKGAGDAAIEGALEVGDGGGGEEEAGFGRLGISVWGRREQGRRKRGR
jgi:hypothetical protein